MQNANHPDLVPAQQAGAQSNTVSQKELSDEKRAMLFFKKAAARLNDVNSWQKYAGKLTAAFQLCDSQGKEVQRTVQMHDHFRMDGPGPGSVTGSGYDWVKVEAFEKESSPTEELICIRVRPVSNPVNKNKDVAHFFTDDSTSSFIVKRMGMIVSAEVYGRNEKLNTEANNLIDKARNALAGTVATAFYSKIQWKSLTDGLLDFDLT